MPRMDGLHAMFKHHFIWIAKDISTGYQPDTDMYTDPPSAGRRPAPTPPDTPKGKPTQPRANARPEPAAGAADGPAAGALAAEEEGDAAATAVEEPVAMGPGAGKRAQRVPAKGKSD